jgi:hypothetical protein
VRVEGEIAGSLHDGRHQVEVLRAAARHHRVDRELLQRFPPVVGRHQGYEVIAGAIRHGQHTLHALTSRRHHRQPVGHLAVESDLDVVGYTVVSGAQ